jgi:hypothetical protein
VSGCFLIWIGGVNRYGVILGMHRPWDVSRTMGNLKYDQAAPMYNRWLADLKDYLLKMQVPDDLYAKLIATVNSVEMRMFENNDIVPLIHDPTFDEWLTNRCGQMTFKENKELGELNWQKYQGRSYNSGRQQQLVDRSNTIANCRTQAQAQARRDAFTKVFGM